MFQVLLPALKQFIVDTNIGKSSWNEWYEWIEGVNDDLPEPEGLESVWDNLPELSPCLIDGVLRKGHKMLISGPSKAGKSFLQIELCIAIAEGKYTGSRSAVHGLLTALISFAVMMTVDHGTAKLCTHFIELVTEVRHLIGTVLITAKEIRAVRSPWTALLDPVYLPVIRMHFWI